LLGLNAPFGAIEPIFELPESGKIGHLDLTLVDQRLKTVKELASEQTREDLYGKQKVSAAG